MGKWIEIARIDEERRFINTPCSRVELLSFRDLLETEMSSSEVLISNQYLRYKLSTAEEWKEVDLTGCSTLELSAIKTILVRVDREGSELELRQLIRKVCVLIDEAVSLLLERRQRLPLGTRLFLVLEDRAIQLARNKAATVHLTRTGTFIDLIQEGWPGRGNFMYSQTRKRPFWTINRRIG